MYLGESSYLVTHFVNEFKGAASVRSLSNDLILHANDLYMNMAHKAPSIRTAMLAASSETEYKGMVFCEFVEQQFKKTNQPTFAFELYDGMYFVTLRMLIKYYEQPAILTLISECSVMPDECNNDIYTCPTAQYFSQSTINPIVEHEKKELISLFVDNFCGKANLQTMDGEDIYGMSTSLITSFHYQYVSQVFSENCEPTFFINQIDNIHYISLLVLITYEKMPVVLELHLVASILSLSHYDIYQCHVNEKLKISTDTHL